MSIEWKTYKLGDVCSRLRSGRGILASEVSTCGKFAVVGGNGVRGYTDTSNFNGQCVVVGRQGAYCGNVRYFDGEFYMTEHAVVIVGNELADTHFLAYLLSTMHLGQLSAQSAQPGLSVQTLSKLEISLPSLEEQRRIAGILGAIDDKIENNRRINTNLELQAQALYKQWFVDNRSNDWEEIKLGDIIEISKKSITPAQSENTIFEHYSLPAFDDGIQPVFEKGKYIKSSKFIVEQNMFLFSKLNPRIKRIWLPDIQTENAICSTEFIPYKPKDIAMFGFCYSIVNSDSFYEYVLSLTNGSTGSHQRFHPIDTLDYELMIPNNDYIAKFEELVMPIYRTIARNRMECKKLATLRDTLLPKLMNGEIKI